MGFEREFHREDLNLKNKVEKPRTVRFVSDQERARRGVSSINNQPDEIVDHGGIYNSLDGTHPGTQEEADARDAVYLAEHPRPQTGLTAEVRRATRRVTRTLRRIGR